MRWRKSTRSGNTDCVEVSRDLPERVAVRDSQDPTGPVLTFAEESWQAFVRDLRRT